MTLFINAQGDLTYSGYVRARVCVYVCKEKGKMKSESQCSSLAVSGVIIYSGYSLLAHTHSMHDPPTINHFE